MTKSRITYLCLSLFLIAQLFHFSHAVVGTARRYSAPYIPAAAACKINPWQFPSDNMFAAAGELLWVTGASCGRQYLVTCTAASVPDACRLNKTIQVTIVDRAQPSTGGATIILSTTAFDAITNGTGQWAGNRHPGPDRGSPTPPRLLIGRRRGRGTLFPDRAGPSCTLPSGKL
ncbi:hypothetical protein FNV43_RR12355 [Rhamnella rubrinervis]|uniref:Expansin-like EG45 domain-containing protein n=1 Tax=Rhamnella rubrinervis TaxID=2594499 RepID=A0A8K0H7L0_9ROSA|nr:hypothetical protein FNV43_RR12355 [Rhamnella rubrinervis]